MFQYEDKRVHEHTERDYMKIFVMKREDRSKMFDDEWLELKPSELYSIADKSFWNSVQF